MDTKELETLDPLHFSPVDVNGSLFGPPFPIVHDQLPCLDHIERKAAVLAVCLIFVADQDYHCCVVSKLKDSVGVVLGHAVVGEQRAEEGAKHAPMRGPNVEEQRGRCVVAYPYNLGAARQEVQDPVAEEGV